MIDHPQQIRPGEEIDAGSLRAFLDQSFGNTSPVEIRQFPGGYSNLTYLVSRGPEEYVLRRPPFGASVKSGHDMEREFKVLSAVRPQYPNVPRPVLYCDDLSVIGAPFYLMERVKGVILRSRPPKEAVLDESTMQRLSTLLVDNLAAIHAIDVKGPELMGLGKPEGYVQRQVEGWTKRYNNAQTDGIPSMEQVAEWLVTHRPAERYVSLIHNDYKYDNLVFSPDLRGILAVLDWEMATVGDPLMDLGTSLGYWIEPGDPEPMRMFGLTVLPGNLNRRQVADRYAERTGRDPGNVVFYYAFGLFKIGVIVQQIYARYRKGLTQDPRFAGLILVVQACGNQAAKAIETNRL
jgi:aminoglycoside phosphotransferase (APT) family kinase protein